MNLDWQCATLIATKDLTPRIKSLTFSVEDFQSHRAGQFYEISLDGGQTSRCYSVASAPEQTDSLEFGIELIDGGEVSTPLHGLQIGETVYIKGPQGLDSFTWDYQMDGDLVLIGGGSGMVPLMAMVRHYIHNYKQITKKILVVACAATIDDIPYHHELTELVAQKIIMYMPLYQGSEFGRLDSQNLNDWLQQVGIANGHCYICGSIKFTNAISEIVTSISTAELTLHREYFG